MTTPIMLTHIVTITTNSFSQQRLNTRSHQLIAVLILLFSTLNHVSAQVDAPTSTIDEPFTCTLFEVATQHKDSQHTVSLHCVDEQGLSFEVQGPTADIRQQYLQANKAISSKLIDAVTSLSSITTSQAAALNAAKAKLQQRLKNSAHPKLRLQHFQRSSDKLFIANQSNWSVFWDEVGIEDALDAISDAEISSSIEALNGSNDRTALVVHITANDYNTSASPSDLSDAVFGTTGDAVNLASQYTACSYGQLNFMPATGNNITDGVVQVNIDLDVAGVTSGTVRNAAIEAGNALLGNLFSQADHIMFAIPPNTEGGWIAYASVNGSSSVYNDNWTTYVSAQMHELGHNLGMGHSGIGGNEYADTSGMMGFSYSSDDGPLMCFNSAKSSKFGWYNDKELSFFESDWSNGQGAWTGKVIGLANYDEVATDQQLLLKIHSENGNVNSSSLNINFNRDAGINSGTRIGKDRLMVVSTNSPTGYNTTLLEADLGSGESQTFENYWLTGVDLIITVNNIANDNNGVLFADIEISVDNNIEDNIFNDGFD